MCGTPPSRAASLACTCSTPSCKPRSSGDGSPRRVESSGYPALAGLAVDVAHEEATIGELEDSKQDRQVETPWPDRARIEDRQAAVTADERNVRVTADDELC